MATSVIAPEYERQLIPFCSVVNKLKRLNILTNVLVAASTSPSDLIARAYAALRSGTTELFGPEPLKLVQRFEQKVKLMQRIGLLNDTIVGLLQTVNTVSASTDLRFIASTVITQPGFDATKEDYPDVDGNYAYASTR